MVVVCNHALVQVAKHPQIKAREIAVHLGITERSVFRIISDLEAEGYLTRARDGRVNSYLVNLDLLLRHPESRDILLGELLKLLSVVT
jgi:DNA-binding IclR family transcriptional regulator